MRFEKIKSHAKVNLSLNVLGKRKSKLHDLETLVAFVDLHDQIFIKRINNKKDFVFCGRIIFIISFLKRKHVHKLINKSIITITRKIIIIISVFIFI